MSISTFWVISFVVLAVSLYTLWQHFRLMKRRGAVDEAACKVEDAFELGNYEQQVAEINAYNEAVKIYNEYISKPPGLISAALVGLTAEELINMPEAAVDE